MGFVRPLRLVFSLLVFLATVWLLVGRESFLQHVGNWSSKFALNVETPFDARLHPEIHARRLAKTVELDWTIRQESRSPDGVQKSVYTVNGVFPGPTIEARSGDRILLRVRNELDTEPTAVHFHGIRQLGSNSMDGTPGLTQCAIQPGHSFLYNFTISDQTGTYWWHSHSLSQRADGLFGAFVIHDPIASTQPQSDVGHSKEDLRIRDEHSLPSERLLLIGDWYHRNSTAMLSWYRSKRSYGYVRGMSETDLLADFWSQEPTPETALFNGVNAFDCSRASRFVECDASKGRNPYLFLDPHSKTRLRLVNTGNLADLEISLGSHSLVVIEADGSRVTPQRVKSVVLSPGQRYSVILEPDPSVKPHEGDSYWLRLGMSEECFNIPNAALDMEQFIRVYYGDSRTTKSSGPTFPFALNSGLPEFDLFSLKPFEETLLPPADQQIKIYVNSMKMDRLGGIPYGYVNQTSWVPDATQPLLLRDTEKSLVSGWGEHQLVVTTDRKAASVVEMIINNIDEGPHPFHLHGHHFYPLTTHKSTYGWGMYNHTAGHYSPEMAPVLRDTLTIPRRGHVVIRFLADAPGMWLFHCHVLVHLSTGMAMTFNVRPDLVPGYEKQAVLAGCSSSGSLFGE